jgi:1-acyl-sn-glycerol-3-phosphate acyltransferase
MGSRYYAICHILLRHTLPLLTSLHVRGIELLPSTGPCVLVVNHLSNVDPLCFVAAILRPFRGLAKIELRQQPLVHRLIAGLDPIYVRRHGFDRQALRQAEHALHQGHMVMVFAEGTRSKTGAVQEARAGVVFLAQRTGVPLVPIAIQGTNRIFRQPFPWYHRTPVQVTVGAPFLLTELGDGTHHTRQELAQLIMARVAALLPLSAPGGAGMA